MIDHISVGVNDLAASRTFYESALAPLGYRVSMEFDDVFAMGTPGPDGDPRAELEICFSGFSGLASRGRLLRGENPVCITFELLVEEG